MQVFLSYPSENLIEARSIYNHLKGLGVSVWFDKESLVGGQDWERERRIAQQSSDLVILLCSTPSMSRAGVIQREINDALAAIHDRAPGEIYLVCIRLDRSPLLQELERFQYIDYLEANWRSRLSQSLALRYQQLGKEVPKLLAAELSRSGESPLRSVQIADAIPGCCTLHGTFFEYGIDDDYWRYVDAEIRADTWNEYLSFRKSFSDPESPKTHEIDFASEWESSTSEVFRSGELVSIRRVTWWYFAGAAHPNSHTTTLTYFGRHLGRASISDLLGTSPDTYTFLWKYVELDVRRQQLAAGYAGIDLSGPEDKSKLGLYSAFTIGASGLTLEFSPYQILAYAFGPQQVFIPWDDLSGKLESTFCQVMHDQAGIDLATAFDRSL